MTLIITGAEGFIGRRLIRACKILDRKEPIVAIDRIKHEGITYPDVKHIQFDLRELIVGNTEPLDDLGMEEDDVIVHLAATSDIVSCNNDPKGAFENNVLVTKALYEYNNEGSNARFFFASSAAANRPENIYGMTKLAAERFAEHGNIMRFHNVYGFGGRGFPNIAFSHGILGEDITVYKETAETPFYFIWADELCNTILKIIDTLVLSSKIEFIGEEHTPEEVAYAALVLTEKQSTLVYKPAPGPVAKTPFFDSSFSDIQLTTKLEDGIKAMLLYETRKRIEQTSELPHL